MQDQQTIYAGNDVMAALGRRHQGRSTMAGGVIVDWKLEVGSRLFLILFSASNCCTVRGVS